MLTKEAINVALITCVSLVGLALIEEEQDERLHDRVVINGHFSERCYNQTSEFEWRNVNGKIYCLDKGKWVLAKENR